MREPVDRRRLGLFIERLGRAASEPLRVYLVGGASAVIEGWRESTIDIDLMIKPHDDALLRAIPAAKEALDINIELASPADFIPLPPGWEERSPFVVRHHLVSFHHFDFYSQALSKAERGHRQDLLDVQAMIDRDLVSPQVVLEYFERIEPELYRFPAIDPASFRRSVLAAFGG
jgi:hypothetical protein